MSDWTSFFGNLVVGTVMARIVMIRWHPLINYTWSGDHHAEVWHLILAVPFGALFAVAADWVDRVIEERRTHRT
jgi:hypothetical protein